MCRIAGILNVEGGISTHTHIIKKMCSVQAHGGPDDEGIYEDLEKGFSFGHRRLSILDLSAAGHQPMCNVAKSLWITFNGEIYNFQVLKKELESYGLVFNTHTDTEVILQAYRYWGVNSFSKFKGMFAFALYDEGIKKTYLVRDANGIKPLYYSCQNKKLVFSSEVKAMHCTGFNFEVDKNWKVYFLAFGHIPEPFSTLKGVFHLEKGHYLSYNHCDGTISQQSFHHYQFEEKINDQQEACEQINQLLHQSVARHLISDAPIGVFLSGGIDSSIITLLADVYQKDRLQTLSINLQETDFAERKYQQIVAQKTEGQHSEYMVTYKDFVTHFDTITAAMDQPSNDGINSWFVCKSARENGLKAVLSGLGGDELFGGYPSFARMKYISAAKKLIPDGFIKMADHLNEMRYKRFYYLSYASPIGEYLFLRGFFSPGSIADLLNLSVKEVDDILQNVPVSQELNFLTGGNRASWFESNLYMQNQLLRDTDYMSMSHGLEVRVPFLDQDLMEYVYQLNPEIKFDGIIPKSLLINSFKDSLPEPIWNRRKMGFSFPFQEWMRRFDKISNPAHYTNPVSQNYMKAFNRGDLHWSNAFALYHVNQEA